MALETRKQLCSRPNGLDPLFRLLLQSELRSFASLQISRLLSTDMGDPKLQRVLFERFLDSLTE